MAETTKKTTTTRRTTKKTTAQPEVKKEAVATNDLMAQMTPELMAQFMQFMAAQQGQAGSIPATPVEKPEKITKAYLNTIRDEEVEVRNVSNAIVTFNSRKTGMTYRWVSKGDVEVMTIGEVIGMHAQSNKFLSTPWLVVEDSRVVEGLGLSLTPQTVDLLDNLDELLDKPIYMIREAIEPLPMAYKDHLADQVSSKIHNKELRDIVLIKELETMLNKEFLSIK